MKQASRLPTLIWALTAILVLVFLVLQFVESGEKAFPSARSYMPSGTHAYAELLKRLGYEVEISHSSSPNLGPNDIAVVYNLWSGISMFQSKSGRQVEQKLKAYGAKKALVLYMSEDFDSCSKKAEVSSAVYGGASEREVRLSIGDKYRFASNSANMWSMDEEEENVEPSSDTTIFVSHGYYDPFAVQSKTGAKDYIFVADAIGSTNRFIDKEQNAAFYAGVLQYLGPKGSKVVFIEDAIHNADKTSVLGTLAPWSGPGRLQLLVLVALTIWMLGKRFGLPEATRFGQRGSKELVDAVADTSLRARATDFALNQIVADCERQIRNALKVGSDVQRQDLMFMLPVELSVPFANCVAGLGANIPDGEALRLVKVFQTATDEFVGKSHRPKRKRRSGY